MRHCIVKYLVFRTTSLQVTLTDVLSFSLISQLVSEVGVLFPTLYGEFNVADCGSFRYFSYNYCAKTLRHLLADELHALAIGRKIVKNLHLAGVQNRAFKSFESEEVREPVYSPDELRGIVPADARTSYDVRSVIARIVDGSEFDEFKKLYGPVSTLFKSACE